MCQGVMKTEPHRPVTCLPRAFAGFGFLILLKVQLCDRTRPAWSQWDRVCGYVCGCLLFELEGGLHVEGAIVVSQPTGRFFLKEGNH